MSIPRSGRSYVRPSTKSVLRAASVAASAALLTSFVLPPAAPAGAAVDANASHVTEASSWLMDELLALQPGTQNGGIYANKPGYHNSREGNSPDNYSVRDAEDQGGPSDMAAAYDWTFPNAQSSAASFTGPTEYAGRIDAADFQAMQADYSTIAKYSQRLLASGRNPDDPRLDGWKEFFGQANNDLEVEGYDFRDDENTSSDDSHLWHIHLSEDRDKVTSFDNKRALLSVLRGETVAEWRKPHGPVYNRARNTAGEWESSATRIDTNEGISGIAAAKLPTDGSTHVFTVVPGNGLWHRKAWETSSTRIDTNPNITATAAVGLSDGTVHAFALIPGSGIWERTRSAAGVWAGSATNIDTNGSITALAATATPDGTIHVQSVVPGAGIYDRARPLGGSWATSATRFDLNGSVTAVASAAQPNGALHILAVIPGSGIWHRVAWQSSATNIDTNPDVTAISAAALPNGTIQLDAAIAGSGVWHRERTAAGSWNTNAERIDTNGRIFSTYTVGLNDNRVYVGTNANIS